MIRLDEYPQLRSIAWSVPNVDVLDEKDALAIYEANWRFVEQERLTDRERDLIQRLAKEFGNGVLNV